MDDFSRFQLPLLSQMLRKHEAADTIGPSKCAAVPCQNWHLGIPPIPVLSGISMGSVQNVEESTKHETMKCASLLSKLAAEKDLVRATQTAEAAILEGPKALPEIH